MIKIYGTLGPSCSQEEILIRMLENGMTGMRINLSHAGLKESEDIFQKVHKAFGRAGKAPDLLIDMQGPEMRIGSLPEKMLLREGDEVTLGADGLIPVRDVIAAKFRAGQKVKLDDGRIQLEILQEGDDRNKARAIVTRGGILSSRKSIAIEGVESDLPPLTEDDVRNIELAGSFRVTGLMQPFVRGGEDIRYVREVLDRHGLSDIRIYAKIENLQGVSALPEIIKEADEIIIARGDLGNAIPLWKLPMYQKEIAARCREERKAFMVVTQMLSSMEHCKVPTRAEVSDIFNAVLDGASSVMVTGETAIGEYPAEVIDYMFKTCSEAEKYMIQDFGRERKSTNE